MISAFSEKSEKMKFRKKSIKTHWERVLTNPIKT